MVWCHQLKFTQFWNSQLCCLKMKFWETKEVNLAQKRIKIKPKPLTKSTTVQKLHVSIHFTSTVSDKDHDPSSKVWFFWKREGGGGGASNFFYFDEKEITCYQPLSFTKYFFFKISWTKYSSFIDCIYHNKEFFEWIVTKCMLKQNVA